MSTSQNSILKAIVAHDYEFALLIDCQTGRFTSCHSSQDYEIFPKEGNYHEELIAASEQRIYPSDRRHFLHSLTIDAMREALERSQQRVLFRRFSLIDHSEDLDRYQRSHRYHRDNSERICQNISANSLAGAHRKGQKEGRRHRSGSHAAGVKGDRREYLRHKKAENQSDQISGYQKIQYGDSRDYTEHRKSYSRSHSHGQRGSHRFLGDSAAGDLLHLLVQHMYGRLCRYDKPSDHHSDQDQDPMERKFRDLFSEIISGRHKADIYSGKEQYQSDIGIHHSHNDLDHLSVAQMQGDDLEARKKYDDRGKSERYLFK